MAQEWAKSFYNSRRWKKARKIYYENVHGICERCGARGLIVHHKVALTPDNITDDNVTLNPDNFELLCQDCHNAIDHERLKQGEPEEKVFTDTGDYMPPFDKKMLAKENRGHELRIRRGRFFQKG